MIYDYISDEQTEINIKESTNGEKIKNLCWPSKHLCHKSFRAMTKQVILGYLNGLKKPVSDDPKHKSIGTHNGRQIVFLKFFRWLYNPDEPDHRNTRKIQNAASIRIGEEQSFGPPGVVTKFAERLSASLPPVIHGNGHQTRDFIFVDDVVSVIVLSTALADKKQEENHHRPILHLMWTF
ncbi:MAG: NAD-dependent epimerase/dehydratase family protein [Thermoproteota archaeon]|nr:NAD-dependent epimerase/dehydratase family protein [Thermoproteota archaeon]